MLCGSIVSGLRMRPGNWAGAYACWGTENREAAVRFVKGGPGSAYGGNVEVKIVDPSANPYLASAAILGLALDGIRRRRRLPPETTIDPAKLSDSDRERAGHRGACPISGGYRLPRWIIRRCYGASWAIPRSTWWSRSAVWSTSATATWTPSSWPTSSGWPGACDGADVGSRASHRRSGIDRSARARMLADGGGSATVRERPQRGQHRATRGLGFRLAARLRGARPLRPHPGIAQTR